MDVFCKETQGPGRGRSVVARGKRDQVAVGLMVASLVTKAEIASGRGRSQGGIGVNLVISCLVAPAAVRRALKAGEEPCMCGV